MAEPSAALQVARLGGQVGRLVTEVSGIFLFKFSQMPPMPPFTYGYDTICALMLCYHVRLLALDLAPICRELICMAKAATKYCHTGHGGVTVLR